MSEEKSQAVATPVEILLDKPRQIKYTIGVLRMAESALGGFTGPLGLNILCALLLYGLREEDPGLTPKKLDGLLDNYLQSGGGSMEEISDKVRTALERAGVAWGKKKKAEDEGA